MATTQDDRLLQINTPLGANYLLLDKISGSEYISDLFHFDLELLHEEPIPELKATYIDPGNLIGQAVTIGILQPDDTSRYISGMVRTFAQGERTVTFSHYVASIVPHVWLLTQKTQSRIFQNLSVPDILRKVFDGFQVEWDINGLEDPRNYCVQYGETDFAFASRLMEEEGLCYFFKHTQDSHTMVVTNQPTGHPDCPSNSSYPSVLSVVDDEGFVSSIASWRSAAAMLTGKVARWDYHFQLPSRKLDGEQPSRFSMGENQKLESYEYPGGYAKKYDGIDKTGAEQPSELNKIDSDKSLSISNSIDSFDAQVITITAQSNCVTLSAGHKFTLFDHPDPQQNGEFLLTAVSHHAVQEPGYGMEDTPEGGYLNSFTCIKRGPGAPPFKPRRTTPKPIIRGAQTAFVVGPQGEELFTDKYGRVKVQFHWDRESLADSSSSCWVRVAQSLAGNKWGGIFIPRIGMEVVVDFLEGDPDQPIITGCVYNADAMPPYTLPDEKTKSTLKTISSKGGGGFNELRFEDKKGSEQIFVHAEKNTDLRVKNDLMEYIGNERHLIVKKNQFETIEQDKHLKITGDLNEKAGGGISITAGMDIEAKAQMKYAVDAGTEVHLKSGTTLTLETGVSLTLKVGGNFININSAGIFIQGTMVMVNSGGAAGSGSGSSPAEPQAAKEADRAEPGSTPAPPRPAPPPSLPLSLSPAALVLVSAAQNGSPFCEICSRG